MLDVPITSVLLTVRFDPPADTLSILDYTDFSRGFAEEYPIFSQIIQAGPMSHRIEDMPMLALGALNPMPRIQLTRSDLTRKIMFQFDRLSYGWNRVGSVREHANYPGFDEILSEFGAVIETLREFAAAKNAPHLRPVTGELAYVDAFDEGDDRAEDLASMFTVFERMPTPRAQSFNCTWVSPLAQGLDGFTATVIDSAGVGSHGFPVATLQTTTSFNLDGAGWDELPSRFLEARKQVGEAFENLVKPQWRTKSS